MLVNQRVYTLPSYTPTDVSIPLALQCAIYLYSSLSAAWPVWLPDWGAPVRDRQVRCFAMGFRKVLQSGGSMILRVKLYIHFFFSGWARYAVWHAERHRLAGSVLVIATLRTSGCRSPPCFADSPRAVQNTVAGNVLSWAHEQVCGQI